MRRHHPITIFLGLLLTLASMLSAAASLPREIQWASGVIDFSSQESDDAGAATQALGTPRSLSEWHQYSRHAWSSLQPDSQREFLELGFEKPAHIRSVVVYETFNPGAVDRILIRDASGGEWTVAWSAEAESHSGTFRVIHAEFDLTEFPVDAVRVEVDAPAVSGFNQIDAVGISPVRTTQLSSWRAEPPQISPVEVYRVDTRRSSVRADRWIGETFHGIASVSIVLITPEGEEVGDRRGAISYVTNPWIKEWEARAWVPFGTPEGTYGIRYIATDRAGNVWIDDFHDLVTVYHGPREPPPGFRFTHAFGTGTEVEVSSWATRTVEEVSLPVMNEHGHIAARAELDSGSAVLLWDGDEVRVVAAEEQGLPVVYAGPGSSISINDDGWVAFAIEREDSPGRQLFKSDGEEAVLIDETSHDSRQYWRPSINNDGWVAYYYNDEEREEIRRGNGSEVVTLMAMGDPLPVEGSPPVEFFQQPMMLEDGSVIYMGAWDHGEYLGQRNTGLFRDDLELLAGEMEMWSEVDQTAGVSPRGDVAFFTSFRGLPNADLPLHQPLLLGRHLHLHRNGANFAYGHNTTAGGRISINDHGEVLYHKDGLRLGHLANSHLLIRRGDWLEKGGSFYLSADRESLNNRTQVAFRSAGGGIHPTHIWRAEPIPGATIMGAHRPDRSNDDPASGSLLHEFDHASSKDWFRFPQVSSLELEVFGEGAIAAITGFSAGFRQPFRIYAGDVFLGEYASGDSLDLRSVAGNGVSSLRIERIEPVDPVGIVLALRIEFDRDEVELAARHPTAPELLPPPDRLVLPGRNARLTVVPLNDTGLTFQWFREGTPLEDGPRIRGAGSAQLDIIGVGEEDAGSYELTATDNAGQLAVAHAEVRLATPYPDWVESTVSQMDENADQTAPEAAPLGDRVPNLHRYAFGFEDGASVANRERLPKMGWADFGQTRRPALRQATTANGSGFALSVEVFDDFFSEWQPAREHLRRINDEGKLEIILEESDKNRELYRVNVELVQ